ncbi:MAG: AGE family epimerase/isomerase, partial [Bacteroidales bacterium]
FKLGYVHCQISTFLPPDEKLTLLRKACEENLTNNILAWWSAKMPDDENKGFYGRVNFNNEIIPDAPKGGILNARILWTYSAAYRITKNTEYLNLARRAKDYIITYFIDREYGGAYYSLSAAGEPLDTRKHTYTQAFFIYGFSEYYRATGDREALQEALNIFEMLEKNVLDNENGGYFEAFSRNWTRLHDRMIGEKTPEDEKSMNTSLHILEAFANLYRVYPEERIRKELNEMIEIFLNKIVDNKTGHLILFFDRNWNGTSQIDSYGHDIESSWLLYEAAGLLKDKKLIDRVKELSIKIAEAAAEGLQTDGSMATEKDKTTGHTTTNRSWWEQAETVVGYLNAYKLSGKEEFLNIAIKAWNYIDRFFVDKKSGGWYSSVTPEGTPRGDRAGHWICPYHNGRMCMEVMERINP